MFGLSMMELMIIAVVALMVLGPDELPKAARSLGKTLRDVRRASDDLRDTFEREVMTEQKPPQIRRPEGETAARVPATAANAPPAPLDAAPPAEPGPAIAAATIPEAPAAPLATATPPAAGFSLGDDPFSAPKPPEHS